MVTSINSYIGLFEIGVTLDEDTNDTRLTSNDEAALGTGAGRFQGAASCSCRVLIRDTTESRNGCDREVFLSWCSDVNTLVLSVLVEEEDLAKVCADDEATSTVVQPRVAGVILRKRSSVSTNDLYW